MAALAPYLKEKKKHNEMKARAKAQRRQKAFNVAVSLAMGNVIPNWTLDGSSVTKRIGDTQRTYIFDSIALNTEVNSRSADKKVAL